MRAKTCNDCGETLSAGMHGLYCQLCGDRRRKAGLELARAVQPPAAPNNKCADCGCELSDRRVMRCKSCAKRHNGRLRVKRYAELAAREWRHTAPPPGGYAPSAPGMLWW